MWRTCTPKLCRRETLKTCDLDEYFKLRDLANQYLWQTLHYRLVYDVTDKLTCADCACKCNKSEKRIRSQ